MLRRVRNVTLFIVFSFAALSLGSPAFAQDSAGATMPSATDDSSPANPASSSSEDAMPATPAMNQPAPAAQPAKPMAAKPAPAKPMMAQKTRSRTHLSVATRKSVQTALNNQGANLKVDGMLGGKTRAALKKFQSDNGLPATGEPDAATLAKLGVK